MTTIAWDGYSLAADSQETRRAPARHKCTHCDNMITDHQSMITKIQLAKHPVQINGQWLTAWAGAGSGALIDLYSAGITEGVSLHAIGKMACKAYQENPNNPNMCLVVITDQSAWEVKWDARVGSIMKEITEIPYSIGSGSKAALLAMRRLGLSAMAGVACGIDVDPHSGGDVCYVHCRDGKDSELMRYAYTEDDLVELFS